MKNTATESRLGTFYLPSCSKTFMKEIPSDAALRNYNSSKDKRNYNSPYTSLFLHAVNGLLCIQGKLLRGKRVCDFYLVHFVQ